MKRSLQLIGVILILSGNLWSQEEAKVSVETLLKTSQSWDGRGFTEYPEGQPEITILRITIPAGVSLPMHKHPVINAGIVLKGELIVTLETGKVLNLKVGDSIAEVVNTWHYGKNQGEEPVELLIFYAGIEGEPITVLKSQVGQAHED